MSWYRTVTIGRLSILYFTLFSELFSVSTVLYRTETWHLSLPNRHFFSFAKDFDMKRKFFGTLQYGLKKFKK
jgi:hypothetical protein